MEIERKFLVSKENLPADLNSYPHHRLEQGYLSTAPVVRIRKEDDNYYLTYKSKGLMTREEYNLPLNAEAFAHLKEKIDGILIQKNPMNICVQKLTESSFPKPAILSRKKIDSPLNWMYLMLLMKDSISQKWNFLLKNRRSVIIHPYGLAKMLRTPVNIITVV